MFHHTSICLNKRYKGLGSVVGEKTVTRSIFRDTIYVWIGVPIFILNIR